MKKIFNEKIREVSQAFQDNSTRVYLVLANIILVVFAIWFSNVGLLPFGNMGDFIFFVVLSLVLSIYRPGWTFVFFVGMLALENINLAPKEIGLAVRPYQLLGALTAVSLIVQIITKRLPFSLPKLHWCDGLAIAFVFAGVISSLFASNKSLSFKQAVVAASFVALYFLSRVYVQSLDDLKRIMPFFLGSSVVIVLYGIWQNIRFGLGANSFEVMPGRPNATFTEPDWLGIFLVFLLATIFVIIFYKNKKDARWVMAVLWCVVMLDFILLILTVSRSAWIGAFIVTLGFLKVTLLDGSLKYLNWRWKAFSKVLINVVTAFALSVLFVYIFHLTTFQLGNRAVSTGGLQKITIACEAVHGQVPNKIESIDQLEQYACWHINLEDIEKERNSGHAVLEVDRPDPNVGIRARIYATSWQQIKQHSILGIGWGSISKILGTDERGAGLNASNIFLETWLGAGILGFLSLVGIFIYIFSKGVDLYLRGDKQQFIVVALLLPWTAIVVPNLFNSGIFLGFVWTYLGVAISLLAKSKKSK